MEKPADPLMSPEQISKVKTVNSDSFQNGMCLSEALENLPLVYLPHTKQLVSVSPPHMRRRKLNVECRDLPSSGCSKNNSTCASPESKLNGALNNLPEENGEIADNSGADESTDDLKLNNNNGNLNSSQDDFNLSNNREALSLTEPFASNENALVDETNIHENADEENLDISCHKQLPVSVDPCCGPSETSDFTDISSLSSSISVQDTGACSLDVADSGCPSATCVDVVSRSDNSSNLSTCSVSGSNACGCGGIILTNSHHSGLKFKKGSFVSFFTSTLFGGKLRNRLESSLHVANNNMKPGKLSGAGPDAVDSQSVAKKSDMEKSTTALILQCRPDGLPSKDPLEEEKHRQMYESMIEEAKLKERRDAKRLRQKIQQQLKREEATSNALKIWNNELLPNWDTVKQSKRTRDIWWLGIPPSIRGRVWRLAIANELNITSELYEICLVRSQERLRIAKEAAMSDSDSLSSFNESSASRESSVELIRLDVSRTFPSLCIFQKGGPYHDMLQGLLGSYACYRPDVGYVQGMSFIAAVLLLNMDVADAFICFANLLNRPILIAFFRLDEALMKAYFDTYMEFFRENLPKLYNHLSQQKLTADLYIIDWMFTLYAKSLSLDVVSRVWDVFFRDGEEFLFRTALGILKLYEDVLLNMDFIQLAQFLTRLPTNISAKDLFLSIESISMQIDKVHFSQILGRYRTASESHPAAPD